MRYQLLLTVRSVAGVLGGAVSPNSPNRSTEMQFARFCSHHAVEVSPRTAAEVIWRFCRHDGDRDRGLFSAQGKAGVAPDGFGDSKFIPRPISCFHDFRPFGDVSRRYGVRRCASFINSTGVILSEDPESVRERLVVRLRFSTPCATAPVASSSIDWTGRLYHPAPIVRSCP
jgi:hypothetical protein